MMTATAATEIVDWGDRVVAAIVTGARIRSANGLFSPPVKNNNAPNWTRSKVNVRVIPRSDIRLFSG